MAPTIMCFQTPWEPRILKLTLSRHLSRYWVKSNSQRSLSPEFGQIFCGAPKPVIFFTDNKAVTQFFQMKIVPPALWNACDYVIQFNFVKDYFPRAQNTAAEYLSRLELDPKEKLVMKIRADVNLTNRNQCPIRRNVTSRPFLLHK